MRSRGSRVTSQRLLIWQELQNSHAHMDAQRVFDAVRRRLPGTSKPAVYAALDLFVELGVICKLDVGVGVALYDACTAPHPHLVCRDCHRVEDLRASVDISLARDAAQRVGFVPDQVDVVIHGLCENCRLND